MNANGTFSIISEKLPQRIVKTSVEYSSVQNETRDASKALHYCALPKISDDLR